MESYLGYIVRPIAGHDKGSLCYVVGCEENFVLLVDGKTRRLEKPKRKKMSHVEIVCRGSFEHANIRQFEAGQTLSNKGLREALAVFRDTFLTDQGGN